MSKTDAFQIKKLRGGCHHAGEKQHGEFAFDPMKPSTPDARLHAQPRVDASPPARAAVPPRRSPRTSAPPASAPTPATRSADRPRTPAWSASLDNGADEPRRHRATILDKDVGGPMTHCCRRRGDLRRDRRLRSGRSSHGRQPGQPGRQLPRVPRQGRRARRGSAWSPAVHPENTDPDVTVRMEQASRISDAWAP